MGQPDAGSYGGYALTGGIAVGFTVGCASIYASPLFVLPLLALDLGLATFEVSSDRNREWCGRGVVGQGAGDQGGDKVSWDNRGYYRVGDGI